MIFNAFEQLIKVNELEQSDGQAVLHVMVDKDHMNASQTLHGGFIASLLDSASGYAGLSTLSKNYGLIAVQFNVNFVRVASEGELIAEAKVIKSGIQVLHIESVLLDKERVAIACAQGVWLVQRNVVKV